MTRKELIELISNELELTEELPKDFIALSLEQIAVFDKMARIKNLTKRQEQPSNESLDDSYSDIGNYALIALMVRRGCWK